MRNKKAKRLRREAAKAFPKGSTLMVKQSSKRSIARPYLYWTGARRHYQDSKRRMAA